MPETVETTHQTRPGPVLKRRRAARACLSCRSRKVRCDVSRSGPPCMNCSLDAIACVVKARKPKSSARHGSQVDFREDQQSSASPDHVGSIHVPEPSSQPVDTTDYGAAHEAAEATQQLAAHNGTFDHGTIEDRVMELMFPQDAGLTVEQQTSLSHGPPAYNEPPACNEPVSVLQHDWMAELLRQNDTGHVGMSRVDVPCTHRRQTTHKNSVVYTYYPFLTLDNLYNCLPHDVDFLEAEGCFHLPTRKIMDQIVRQYFLHVHPLLPILNEGDFWDMYHHKRSHSPSSMSLLVVQAMMFVACNFVNWSPESTRSVGYKNTRGLRATFYRRAKLLYDFGAESSPVAIAQASLLLSYWVPPVGTELRSNTVWLSVAIESAKNADAPYHATRPAPPPRAATAAAATTTSPEQRAEAKQTNLLKRLWWCCVIRDRILPLGLRRGIQITRAHFDFAKHQPLGLMDLADEVHRSVVYNADAKRELIRVLAHVLDLCVILTDVLLLVFPLDGRLSARGRAAMPPLQEAHIRGSKKALVHWYTAAVATSATAAGGGPDVNWNKHDSVILYTHLMFTYYHSARMALYNHELQHYLALMAENSPVDTHKLMETREAIQNACSNITENIRGLNQRHLTRWLPISAVAYVAFPLALHVLNTHLSARQNPSSGTLIEVMMTMHSQYDGVHWVAKLVRHLVALVQADSTLSAGRNVASWAELLTFKPRTYLRLALAMDLSMSSGRLPDKKDFPAQWEVQMLRQLASPKAGVGSAGVARGGPAALAVDDSALSADFFDVDFSRAPFVAQEHQALDSLAADTEEPVGVKTGSIDVPREHDQSQQERFGDEDDRDQDDPLHGRMMDEMDTFFDPALADVEGGEDSSATDEGLRAFGSGFEDSTVLAV